MKGDASSRADEAIEAAVQGTHEVTRQWSDKANFKSQKDGVRSDRGLEGSVEAWERLGRRCQGSPVALGLDGTEACAWGPPWPWPDPLVRGTGSRLGPGAASLPQAWECPGRLRAR